MRRSGPLPGPVFNYAHDASHGMELSDGEEKVAQYFFAVDDAQEAAFLTSARLAIVRQGREESYLLGHIAQVKFARRRRPGLLAAGIFLLIGSISPGGLGVADVYGSSGWITWMVTSLLFLIGGVWLTYLGWSGRPHMLIRENDGTEHWYVLKRKDPNLLKFINAVDSTLSIS